MGDVNDLRSVGDKKPGLSRGVRAEEVSSQFSWPLISTLCFIVYVASSLIFAKCKSGQVTPPFI